MPKQKPKGSSEGSPKESRKAKPEEFKGPRKAKPEESFKVIRIAESDIYGTKKLKHGLTRIKGIGWALSHAILTALNLEDKKVGDMTDEEINKVKDALADPAKYGVPTYMLNRRKDRVNGKDIHLVSSDLVFAKKMDIESLMKKRCYRGIRHMHNYKVRGQRTRSRGANVKGRVGSTVGVVKKKQAPQKTKK